MPLPSAKTLQQRFIASRQLLPGDWANAVADAFSSVQALTASVTQTQAGGTKVTAAGAVVTTANANDAVTLPKAYAGLEVFMSNISANALGVFPAVGDTIFPSAQNAVLAHAASKVATYKCLAVDSSGNGTWHRNLSA